MRHSSYLYVWHGRDLPFISPRGLRSDQYPETDTILGTNVLQDISYKVQPYNTTSQYSVPLSTHNEEHTRLLQKLERSSGKWDTTHPRHRLLTALHGYTRYKDKNLAEVDRLRNLYKNVPKRQRTV